MTASRDIQTRTTSSQRPSLGSIAQSLPSRNSYNRNNLSAASLSSVNSAHRVSRRKSSFSVASVNVAAITAAAKDGTMDTVSGARSRGSAQLDKFGRSPNVGSLPSPGFLASSLKQSSTVPEKIQENDDSSALEDGPALASMTDKANRKSGARRSSEGSRLTRTKSNAGELRCETCGKGYKHGSCLTKHLWEHTPEWQLTSKLLISKHQQVQLLEAASVLLAMNGDGLVPAKPATLADSDMSSESPAASGSSDPADHSEMSSRNSTPSAPDEIEDDIKPSHLSRPITRDGYADQFSQSYRSTGGSSFAGSSIPQDVSYLRRWSTDRRQSSASNAYSGSPYEQEDLAAAAAGLLSCSIGTPKSGPSYLQADVPPVPPLPAKFAKEYHRSRPSSYSAFSKIEASPKAGRVQQRDYDQDIDMDEDNGAARGRSEEEDDGVFGTMEQ